MAAINAVTDLTREGDIAVLTIDSPPVNALSADVRTGLRDGVGQAMADPAVKAIVLICAGRTFIAGADIAEFGKPPKGAPLTDSQAAIEGGTKPVIAAIHGTALGGGFEVALMCHYRVAVPSARFGLARDQARDHSRRRRHPAPAAPDWRRECAGSHSFWHAVSRETGPAVGRHR